MALTIAILTNTGRFAWVNHRMWIRRLQDSGHRVVLLTDPGSFGDRLTSLGIAVFPVEIPRTIAPIADLRALLATRSILRRVRPDVVHTYTSKAGVLGRIAGRLAGVPVVVHTLQGLPFYAGQPRGRYALYAFFEWVAARFGDALFSEGREDAATARSLRLAPRARLHHIGSGIPAAEFDRRFAAAHREATRRALGLSVETRAIAVPARLEPVKGHAFFLDAIGALQRETKRPFVVLFAGEGPLRAELDARAQALGLAAHVRFLGFVEDMVGLLKAADIVALPSEKEGIPRVVMEAMLAGLPVVATDVLGTREVVVNGVTGYLAPFGDPAAMAKSLAYLVERPEACRRMGVAGRERALSRFDDRKVAARVEDLYTALLRERRAVTI